MIYKLQSGRTIPLGGDYLEYLQSIPETYGGSIQPSIKVESLPKKFNGSQQAARTYAEGYQKGAKPVTKAIDNAGQKIFNTTKNVAMFVPRPTGAITWLGQMGADTANGEYSKVAKDLVAAALIGAGLKGAQVGAKAAGRALAGKGVNIPWLDAYDYSALRNEYFNRVVDLRKPETFVPILDESALKIKSLSPKQIRVVSEGTYPLYTGPKHSVTEVVNPDGTVNPRAALRIEREVADNIPGAYRMEARLENPEWHKSDPTTWEHTKNVAQSAWTIPTPKGITKQDQMIAALGHDFGKIVSGDGHAQSSAALIEQIFPDVTESQLTAIAEHMSEPKSVLGKVTKQADILNGQSAIIRTVQPNGKIRLSLPSHTDIQPRQFVLDPQGNNKFYVHMRTWDGDHIPANLSPEDKTTLFNALYEELPEGAEILFPQSGPGNYATRGTVAGLQRLARDSRFRPGDKGILEYVDKDGSVKTFEGTSFIKNILSKKQGGKVKRQSEIPESAKAKSYFAGLKDYILHKTKSFIPSQYKPTKGNNIQVQYYTRPGLKEEVALNLFGGTDKNAKNFIGDSNYFYKDFDEAYQDLSKEYIANSSRTASNGTLGEYGVSAGTDDNGRYISFIDNFDHVFIPGKGIPIYDRIYENEINSVYNKNRSAFDEGDWITKSPVLQKLKKKQTK